MAIQWRRARRHRYFPFFPSFLFFFLLALFHPTFAPQLAVAQLSFYRACNFIVRCSQCYRTVNRVLKEN